MTLILVLTAALVAIVTVWKLYGKKLKDSKALQDTDLSIRGLVNALGIAVLGAYCIAIGIMATQLVGYIADQDLGSNTYAEAAYTEPLQVESSDRAEVADITSEVLPEASPEEDAGLTTDNQIDSSEPTTQKPANQTVSQESTTAASSANTQVKPVTEPTVAQEFADGTYSGTGYGFRGDITVAVSIKSGNITEVAVTDQQEDRKWFERAYSGVVQRILSAQSANVDTVSGATYSSRGIIDGVAEALNKARTAVKQVGQ